ncbi:MAG: 2-oxoglutarate dehydrogenase E1 component [Planctomycetes bacterium]|nr:2-oxoglutarate dehydrogenase E1 component [Planctomycetota bacterium]
MSANPASPGQQSPRAITPSVNGWHGDFLESEYQRFKADPSAVNADTRAFFQGFDLAISGVSHTPAEGTASPFQAAVDDLINTYREIGHLAAKLDPFGRERARPAALSLAAHGLSEADLPRLAQSGLTGLGESATLADVVSHLEQTYCRSIGIEFMHIPSAEERQWFLQKFEHTRGAQPLSRVERVWVLDQLARAEVFEAFLAKRYGSEKRFSLEGGTSFIPLCNAIVDRASELGVDEMVLGMAHRGRLNGLINIMGKTYEQVFTEFEDNWEAGFADGGGDVKYHRGYSNRRQLANGKIVLLSMASNPSHLESVNAVCLGRCRAKQRLYNDKNRTRVLPLLVHGDGALPGQGVVAETLNMSQLEGYKVGGAIHVVINNLVAFTTAPEDDRSTHYCTDIAKFIDAPVLHVNGEDPEACVTAARLAIEYRQAFKKDIFIDMYCYRKYGHNEGDEQSFTQPILASLIKSRPTTLALYTERLLAEKIIEAAEAKAITDRLDAALDSAQSIAKKEPQVPTIDPGNARWKGMTHEFSFEPVKTGVSMAMLEEVCKALGSAPEGFAVNPKLKGLLDERATLTVKGEVNHANGELLAIGTLLLEGTPVRLTGQDCRRGTFTQRHAVIRDVNTGQPYVALNEMREQMDPSGPLDQKSDDGRTKQARFCVYDSPLSEFSVMGFDYGYSMAYPNMLVMWEAQFGDFANGAQVMIDQYIASSEIKWNRWSGLVLLLPHGYEGAGPEHSSCRLERFLMLCADENIQVIYPTTGAQIFHALRRQLKRNFRKPLIVATPKSMLRTPTAKVEELVNGAFQEVIDDPAFPKDADVKSVKRVCFCSGKVYYELAERRRLLNRKDIAIVRLEQLYPFHEQAIKAVNERYPKAADRVYVQEEPRNAGCYLFVADQFRERLGINLPYIGRHASATPAVGSKKADKHQQEDVISQAIGPKPKEAKDADKKPAPEAKPQTAKPVGKA